MLFRSVSDADITIAELRLKLDATLAVCWPQVAKNLLVSGCNRSFKRRAASGGELVVNRRKWAFLVVTRTDADAHG